MSWEIVSALGSAGGALAVTATVIYLAIQTRKNALALQSQTVYMATEALAELSAFIVSDIHRGRIYRIGLSDEPSKLNEDEFVQFAGFGISQFRRFENLYFQHRSGLIDDDFWSGHEENILWYFHRPGTQLWWKHRRLTFSKSFRNYLEGSGPKQIQASSERPF